MKKSQIVIWSILIALVFVHYFYMPERPEVTRGEMHISFDSRECRPDLVDLWNTLVQEQAFSNESAVLIQLNQYIDKDGTVQCTELHWIGYVDGEEHAYEVYVHQSGNVYYNDQVFDFPMQGVHPLAILREADRIEFDDLTRGEYNITLTTFKDDGPMTYNKTNGDLLYVFVDGSLRPLKEATFSSEVSWHVIEIFPEIGQSGGITTAESIPDRIIIFPEQEIARADSVVYA
jgi:hypothetical protein